MALLSSKIKAISNFGGMWSYLEAHEDRDGIREFEGIADFSQTLPKLFLLGDQNRFVLAVAPKKNANWIWTR